MAKALKYCSFCGKSEKEVRTIIEGPSVGICDECVAVAAARLFGDRYVVPLRAPSEQESQ